MHNFIICKSLLIQLGFTPLHLACQEGKADTAEVLIKSGAEIDIQAIVGISLFMLCTYMYGNYPVSTIILYLTDFRIIIVITNAVV